MKYYYNVKQLFSILIYLKNVVYSCVMHGNYSSLQSHMILRISFKYADLLLKKFLVISVENGCAA